MRATEMHDLLREAHTALLANPIWQKGVDMQLGHISYCRYCSYSMSDGHGENCVLARLERATSPQPIGKRWRKSDDC